MEKKKIEVIDKLFEKYFEVENGVNLMDITSIMSVVSPIWKNLCRLLVQNSKYFSPFITVDKIKEVEYDENKYLIIRSDVHKYIIIDLATNKTLSRSEVQQRFPQKFFINNFSEVEVDSENDYTSRYTCLEYNSAKDIIDYYHQHKGILSIPSRIHYRIKQDDTWTSLYVDFANSKTYLNFQTEDQFIWEFLYLTADLVQTRIQATQSTIGLEKMTEISDRTKDIIIPVSAIPKEIYQIYESVIGVHSQAEISQPQLKKANN